MDDAQCRDAFGLGASCDAEGLCTPPRTNPRCTSAYPPELLLRPENHGSDLILGTLFDGSTDQPQVQAAQLAVDQLGQVGGFEGRNVGIVHCTYEDDPALDDLSVAEAAIESVAYLVDELGAALLIGPASSDQCFAVYDAVVERDTVFISPSATSPALTDIDGTESTDAAPGLFWRTVPPDDLQGLAMATDLLDRGVESIALIHQDSTYGNALADVAVASLAGSVTVTQTAFSGDLTRDDAVLDAGNSTADEVVFVSSEARDIVAFLNSAGLLSGYTTPGAEKGILLADAAADPFVLESLSLDGTALLAQVRGTRPQIPDGPVLEAFLAAYAAAYEGEDASEAVFAPTSYDAAWAGLYALAWAELQESDRSGAAVGRGMRRLSRIGADTVLPVRPSSWEAVLTSFRAGEAVDIEGASGGLDFFGATGETRSAVEVWIVQDGAFTPVKLCAPDGTCLPV